MHGQALKSEEKFGEREGVDLGCLPLSVLIGAEKSTYETDSQTPPAPAPYLHRPAQTRTGSSPNRVPLAGYPEALVTGGKQRLICPA